MEAVPWLRAGCGASPDEGGCILQVISWVATRAWTDEPECVNHILRSLAVDVNDTLDDRERQKLLDLVPRLMGTAEVDKLGRSLHTERDQEIAAHLCDYDFSTHGCEVSLDCLIDMLDEYDRFTGRKSKSGLLDYSALCAIQQPIPA